MLRKTKSPATANKALPHSDLVAKLPTVSATDALRSLEDIPCPAKKMDATDASSMVAELYQRLISGKADPAFLSKAKSVLGSEDVDLAVRQCQELPEEDRADMLGVYEAMAAGMASGMGGFSMDSNAFHTEGKTEEKVWEHTSSNLKEEMYPRMIRARELYPVWLSKNQSVLEKKEYERYSAQLDVVSKICNVLENDEKNLSGIVQLLDTLSEYGPPPAEFCDLLPEISGGGIQPKMPKPE